jgi:CO/xanthine dehydrogenase Mo-binding subunit
MENERKEVKSTRRTLVMEPKPRIAFSVPDVQEGTLTYVGKRIPMVDASLKVRGKAVYYTDLDLPGMLHAAILRSPHPHARILHINTDRALSLPGVKTVLLPKDTPLEKYGPQVADRPILAREKVRFVGEEVVAVAAVDEETAREAIGLIQVEYGLLPPVLEIDEALREGAPLIHEGIEGNVAASTRIQRGEPEQGWKESDLILEEEFKTSFVHPLYLEPQICVAAFGLSGELVLYLPIQTPFTTRNMMARILGIPLHKIKVVQTHMGGAFGGKLDTSLHFIAALLAQKAGRPVRLANTREEDLSSTFLRVPTRIRIKIGAKRDGTLIAKQVRILADNGAYCSLAPKIVCTNMATRSDCLYRYQHTLTESTLVYTTKVPTSAYRGYGNPQITFAQESLIDMLGHRLGIDPVDIRLKNGIQTGDTTIHGWKIASCGLRECLEEGAKRIGWYEKRKKDPERLRGVGVAAMIHVSGNRGALEWDGSEALIRMHEDGTALLFSGESELGQGKNTVLAQIAAEAMGLSLDHIHAAPVDTSSCPFVLGPYSSKTTVLAGNAVRKAGEEIRLQILETASKMLQLPAESLEVKESHIHIRGETNPKLAVKEVTRYVHTHENRRTLFGHGIFDPGKVRIGPQNEFYGDVSTTYPFAAHFAEVEVDSQTGEISILRYVAAHDVGKAINPMAAEGQIAGGVVQGLGYALMEEIRFREGKIQNPDLQDYTIPTVLDVPPIESILVESNDPAGPYGAKGIGEPTLIPVAPAIANAVFHATGIRMTEIPITAEKLYLAMKKRKRIQNPETESG